jgi:hypothetical protein
MIPKRSERVPSPRSASSVIRLTAPTNHAITAVLAISAILGLAGCSSIEVNSDWLPDADFAGLETFAWKEPPPAQNPDELLFDRIRRATVDQLLAKGLREVSPEEADAHVMASVGVEEKVRVNDPYYAYDAIETYEEGTLSLRIVEPRSGRTLWVGTGKTRLRDAKTPEERSERVRRVVQAVLAEFPPAEAR